MRNVELVNSKIKQLPLFSSLCAISEYVAHNNDVLEDFPYVTHSLLSCEMYFNFAFLSPF